MPDSAPDPFLEKVETKERRRLHARREGERDAMFWLGMFGLVGWSVAVPTVALTLLGVWIDRRSDAPYSWTLMLLFVGVVLGCLNAWYWIVRETRHDNDDGAPAPSDEPPFRDEP